MIEEANLGVPLWSKCDEKTASKANAAIWPEKGKTLGEAVFPGVPFALVVVRKREESFLSYSWFGDNAIVS